MSDRFASASGRKVVSRASAEQLGKLSHLVVDVERRQVASLVVGKGRKALLVAWENVSGFGPDAVMVVDEGALRPPADDREAAAIEGSLALVGKRVLSERGNELGQIGDVTFDAHTGALEDLLIGDLHVPAGSLLGSGSYAAVLDKSQEPS